MLDLYIYQINNNDIDSNLPPYLLDHCKQYKEDLSFLRSLFAWSKVYQLLLKKYKVDLSKQIVTFTENGKPLLSNSPIHFSISHSHSLLAIAISDSEVGCDIERIIDSEQTELLANRLIDKEMLDSLLSDTDKQIYLTKIWTQKESYLKLNGFDINILREEHNNNLEYNTKLIKYSNQHYWCSVVNKNNEKAKKYGK